MKKMNPNAQQFVIPTSTVDKTLPVSVSSSDYYESDNYYYTEEEPSNTHHDNYNMYNDPHQDNNNDYDYYEIGPSFKACPNHQIQSMAIDEEGLYIGTTNHDMPRYSTNTTTTTSTTTGSSMMYVYKNSIVEEFPFYSSVCAHPVVSSSKTTTSSSSTSYTSSTASSFSLNRLSFFPNSSSNNNSSQHHHQHHHNMNNDGILDIIPYKDDRIGSISFHGGLQFHTRGGLLITEYPFQMSLLCGAAIHDRMALGGIHGFHLLDCTTGQMIQSLPPIYSTTSSQTCNITKIMPSPNNDCLYMKCDDGTLRFHDLRSSPTSAAIQVLPFSSSVSNHIQSFDINQMNSMIAISMTQTTDIHFHDARYLSTHNNPTLCRSTNYMKHHGPAQYIQYNNDDTVCIANHVDVEILSLQQQQQDDSSYLLQPPLLPDECITTFQSYVDKNHNFLVTGTNHGTIYTFANNKKINTNVYSSSTSTLDVPPTHKSSSNQGVYVDAIDLLNKSSTTKKASLAKYMTWITMMNQHELFNPNNNYNFVLSSSYYYSKHDSDPLSNHNTIVAAPNNTRILSHDFQQLMIQHNNNPQQKLKNNDDFLMTVSTNYLQTNNDTTMMIFQNYNQYIYSQNHAMKCYDIYADKRQQKQSSHQSSSSSNNNNNSCYSQVSILFYNMKKLKRQIPAPFFFFFFF